jgi:hypothetical protein
VEQDQLLSLFREGLIPGPSETEEEFLLRTSSHFPRSEWNGAPPLPPEWGFSVCWMPLVYSKRKLLPWEAAICLGTHIQLHPTLQTKALFGNTLADILHHEAIHAARQAFDEPQFEEALAYTTSSSSWKRFLGPLFRRSWEFPLFALSLLFFPYTLPIPIFFLLRLFYTQLLFYRAKKKVPLSVLVCLTDQEIRILALSRSSFVPDFSLRGRLVAAKLRSFL